jgi:hypothetical protein
MSGELSSVGQTVARLVAHEEIRQAMYAYARGVDRLDEALITAAYHEDAWDDHGNFRGDRSTAVGTIMRRGAAGATSASMHHIGNILIDLHGDTADVETYFVAYQLRVADGRTYTRMRAGRYLDRFDCRDGRWRIAKRRVVDDWSRLDEVVATAPEVGADNAIGARDSHDASYELDGFAQHWAN